MKRNTQIATILAATTFLTSLVASCMIFLFLPFSAGQFGLTLGCLITGLVASATVFAVVSRLPDTRLSRIAAVMLFVAMGSIPVLSALAPRITYARFGFTVYGAMPIPVLDITVNRNGMLWFRSKTHQITRKELDAIVSSDVDVIVVGIGWDSVAQLTDDAMALAEDFDLRVLPTPDAFELYNALKAAGRSVVLLAHSTC